MGDTSVKVVCRFRPFNDRERRLGLDTSGKKVIEVKKSAVVINATLGDDDAGQKVFPLTHCLDMNATQETLYQVVASPSMTEFFQGFNVTIFAYGQTGSGKSFSMFGDLRSQELRGLVPRCCETIFRTIEKLGNSEFSISCSYCEIYQEKVSDLLDPTRQNLDIRENAKRGVFVENLSWEYVSSTADIFRLIALGDAHKVRRATKMNPNSSRSHCNFCLRLSKKEKSSGHVTQTDLNLVDLAGSERISKTGVTGEALEEAKKINLSLTTLSQCIHALTSEGGKPGYIPFRQSKLTRLLQDSLGGNSKTSMLVACSPHPNNLEETVNSLRFAQRCANVKNKPVVNMKLSVEELEAMLLAMRSELERMKSTKHYEKPEMFDKGTSTGDDMSDEFSKLADTIMEKQVEIELKRAELEKGQLELLDLERQIQRKHVELDSLREKLTRSQEDLPRRKMSEVRRMSTKQSLRSIKFSDDPSTRLGSLNDTEVFASMAIASTLTDTAVQEMRKHSAHIKTLAQADLDALDDTVLTQKMIQLGEGVTGIANEDVEEMTTKEKVAALQRIALTWQTVESSNAATAKSSDAASTGTSSEKDPTVSPATKAPTRSVSSANPTTNHADDDDESNAAVDEETIKLQQKVEAYQGNINEINDALSFHRSERISLHMRVDEQADIIARQNEVVEEFELEVGLLSDEFGSLTRDKAILAEQVDRLKQKIAAFEQEQENERRRLEEEQRRAAEEESSNVLSSTLGFFTKLF